MDALQHKSVSMFFLLVLAAAALTSGAHAANTQPVGPPPDNPRKLAVPDSHLVRLEFAYHDRVLVYSASRMTWFWDVSSGKRLCPEEAPGQVINALAVSGNTEIVAGLSKRNGIWVRNLRTGERRSCGSSYSGSAIGLSHDGTYLGCGGNSRLNIYEVASGRQVKQITGVGSLLSGVIFSRDNSALIVSTLLGSPQLQFADMESGKITFRSGNNGYEYYSVALSPDGRTVAAANGRHSSVLLYDLLERKQIATLPGHTSRPFAVAFSPDGKWLLSGSQDKSARLWEVETRQCVRTYRDGYGNARALAFSGNGRTIAIGGDTKAVFLRDIVPPSSKQADVSLDFVSDCGERKWTDLCKEDASVSFETMRLMVFYGDSAVPVIETWFQRALLERDKHVERLLGQLSSRTYSKRRQASDLLTVLSPLVEPGLRSALRETRSLIAKAHLCVILQDIDDAPLTDLGLKRSIQVLEWIASKEARACLDRIAGHVPDSPYSREARRAIARLNARCQAESQLPPRFVKASPAPKPALPAPADASPATWKAITDGLLHHYTFDGNENDLITNQRGKKHGAVLKGAPEWTDAGAVGGGLTLNYGDSLVLPKDPTASREAFAVAMWFCPGPDSTAQDYAFMKTMDGKNVGWIAKIKWPKLFDSEGQWIHGGRSEYPRPKFEAGKWYHVAISYSGGGVGLFINGEPAVNNVCRRRKVGSSGKLEFFGKGDFAGVVDELRVYDRALSSKEIKQLATRE